MKSLKYIGIVLCLCCSHMVNAQISPFWLDLTVRNQEYPASSYYSGFVRGSIQAGESEDVALQRLKKEAMAEAAASVKVQIQSTTSALRKSMSVQSRGGGFQEVVQKSLETATTTSTEMELPGLKVETYRKPNTNEIYAFAYTRKKDVVRYYDKQITMQMAKLESAIQQVDMLIGMGQKAQAKTSADAGLELLSQIDEAQRMLIVVDGADMEDLQMNDVVRLANELMTRIVNLSQGIYVCIISTEDNFGSPSQMLTTTLKSLLSSRCSFVEEAEQSDYIITLKAKAREGSSDAYIRMAFVDVEVSVFSASKQKVVYTNMVTAKGGHNTWQMAGTEALKVVAKRVNDEIQPFIK